MTGRLFRTFMLLREQANPSTPATGTMSLFAGTDGNLRVLNSDGVITGINPPASYSFSSTSVTSLTTSYATYTNAPSVTTTVPPSGMVVLRYGMVGAHTGTAGSLISVAPQISGANTQAAADTGWRAVMYGRANSAPQTVTRTKLLTGLTSGSTTFALQAKTSNTTGETLWESWINVQPIVGPA